MMATKKATKKVVKFPDTLYVTREYEWFDGGGHDCLYVPFETVEGCATEDAALVGVYQLIGYKKATKLVEIKVEDVNG